MPFVVREWNSHVETFRVIAMPTVRIEDLIDARRVAEMIGLSHPNGVSTYQRLYIDVSRPVVDLGRSRSKLWLEGEIRMWMKDRRTDQAARRVF